MPNDCNYEMKIKGSKRAIQKVIWALQADYDYSEEKKPKSKHFFRVFECRRGNLEDNPDGTFTQTVWGYCAWSVQSCMLNVKGTYYDDVLKNHKDIFMGTSLEEESNQCEIEVFSEEPGMGFSEHYIFKNGECTLDDCVDIQSAGYDDDGNITTDIDWETYEGDQVLINPHREFSGGEYGDYLWNI